MLFLPSLPSLALCGLLVSTSVSAKHAAPVHLHSSPELMKRISSELKPGYVITSNSTMAHPGDEGYYPNDGLAKRGYAEATDYKTRCPGGSVGDAKQCSFQPRRVYNKIIQRWRMYGNKIDNCDGNVDFTTKVSESSEISNSVTESSTVSVSISMGIENEGLSLGFEESVSQTFSETWSSSESLTTTEQITVKPGEEGNMLILKDFQYSEGRIRLVYKNKVDGHWTWYLHPVSVWNPTSTPASYKPSVAECPHGDDDNNWWYHTSDWDDMINGDFNAIDYPENSDDPNCDDC